MGSRHPGASAKFLTALNAGSYRQMIFDANLRTATFAKLLVLLTILFCPISAEAQQKPSGNQVCQIMLINNGIMRADVDNMKLSSKLPGASAGLAQVTTTQNNGNGGNQFALSIDSPLGFTSMPNGGGNGVIFTSSFAGNGATNFSERPGNNPQRLRWGTTDIDVHLVATRTSEPFPAGNYSAELTVRCE